MEYMPCVRHACLCAYRDQKETLGGAVFSLSAYFLETKSLPESIANKTQWSFCFYLWQSWGYRCVQGGTKLVTWILGIATPLLRFSERLLKSEFCLSLSLCEMKCSGNYISLPHYHAAFEKGKEICHMERASSTEIRWKPNEITQRELGKHRFPLCLYVWEALIASMGLSRS